MSRSIEDMMIVKSENGLADKIYHCLLEKIDQKYRDSFRLAEIKYEKFANKELKPQITENVRRRDVYVIHSFCDEYGNYDPNIGYNKLFLLNDALKRSSAGEIINVLPHMPYQRQDRKDAPRTPISARLFANLAERSGTTRIITMDMHAKQEQGFYDIPVDDLRGFPLFVDYFRKTFGNAGNFIVISPDAGGAERAEKFAKYIGTDFTVMGKKRTDANISEVLYSAKNQQKKDIIFIDDMIDSGGTVIKSSKEIKNNNEKISIYLFCTHALLSKKDGDAEDKMMDAGINVITTDSIPRSSEYYEKNKDWMHVISVAPLFAEAIYQNQTGGSVSGLCEF